MRDQSWSGLWNESRGYTAVTLCARGLPFHAAARLSLGSVARPATIGATDRPNDSQPPVQVLLKPRDSSVFSDHIPNLRELRKEKNTMNRESRIANLSPSRAFLIRVMADLGFGRIEGLVVRNGEPVMDPLPRILRTAKFGSQEAGSSRVPRAVDRVLKPHAGDLFEFLEGLKNCESMEIVIQEGLPIRASANVTSSIGGPPRGTSADEEGDAASPRVA